MYTKSYEILEYAYVHFEANIADSGINMKLNVLFQEGNYIVQNGFSLMSYIYPSSFFTKNLKVTARFPCPPELLLWGYVFSAASLIIHDYGPPGWLGLIFFR